jgi:beta-hydroxylase
MKILLVVLFVASVLYVHFRGRVRHKFSRQLKDHSTFLAPINALLYLTSKIKSCRFCRTTGKPFAPKG